MPSAAISARQESIWDPFVEDSPVKNTTVEDLAVKNTEEEDVVVGDTAVLKMPKNCSRSDDASKIA